MWTKPQGYAEIISPTEGIANLDHIRKEQIQAGIHKLDTCTCFHCGGVFHVSARMRPEDIGGMCPTCWHPICPKCLDKPCTPWEAQMDALENAIERRRVVDGYYG
jgi:hypothetical protein